MPFTWGAIKFSLQWKQGGWTHMFFMGKIHLKAWSSILQGAPRPTPRTHPPLGCASTVLAVGTKWGTLVSCWRIQTGPVYCSITVLRQPHHRAIQLRHLMLAMQ